MVVPHSTKILGVLSGAFLLPASVPISIEHQYTWMGYRQNFPMVWMIRAECDYYVCAPALDNLLLRMLLRLFSSCFQYLFFLYYQYYFQSVPRVFCDFFGAWFFFLRVFYDGFCAAFFGVFYGVFCDAYFSRFL